MGVRGPTQGANARKREHAAFLLPIAAALLIVPPLLTVFDAHLRVFGAPLQTVYLFVAWVLMIVGAAVLSRLLPGSAEPDREPDAEGAASGGED